MYYFLDENLSKFASGIEHAVMNRQRLFKKNGVESKIITVNYSTNVVDHVAYWHLQHTDLINLYDYFAESSDLPEARTTLSKLGYQTKDYRFEADGDQVKIFSKTSLVMIAHLFADEQGGVYSLDFLDAKQRVIRTDFYDTRGYRSMSQYFAKADNAQENWVVLEQFFTVAGRIFLEKYYIRGDNGAGKLNHMRLTLKTGQSYMLENKTALYRSFIEQLALDLPGTVTFIADRQGELSRAMAFSQVPARKILCIHNLHYAPYDDPKHAHLAYDALAKTDELSRVDMIIASTPQQAADIQRRIYSQVPVVSVPVGMVSDSLIQQPQVPIAAPTRQQGKIVAVARLFWQKNLADAIRAFAIAQQTLPWLTFDIYGYGDARNQYHEEKQLKKLVAELHLQACVRFLGHTNNIAAVYDHAQMMVLTSRFEGFALALLEAHAHGVPVVTYDINYGPASIVQAGQSGFLVASGDYRQLAEKLVQVFSDQPLLAALSQGAYQVATRFSEAAIWQQWQHNVIQRSGK